MNNSRVLVAGVIGVFAISASFVSSAQALGTTDLLHIHPAKTDGKVPLGWRQVCAAYPQECSGPTLEERRVVLSSGKLRELREINASVNSRIEPVTDQEQFGEVERWSFPTTGKGDCEDYVLEKRRLLMSLGWPRQALLITIVMDQKGSGHAVLTVTTDRGDYVLDNQVSEVLPWSRTGLTFFRRQSASDPNVWVELGRLVGRPETLTASTGATR